MPRSSLAANGRLLLLAGVALIAGGCGTTYPPGLDWAQGWRRARVLDAGAAASLTAQHVQADCRAQWREPWPYARVALVVYSHSTSPNLRIRRVVGLPESLSVKADDEVYVKTDDCNVALARSQP